MTTKPMTPEQEYDFYAQPENQKPQGPAVRRRPRLSDPVPVRFPPELLEQIRRAAEADDRSVSAWLRRAAEHELRRPA
ncbi:YlcI/YnfO family protein [Tomitella fengzijianii]|uniref:Ribbon-helix-helix protein, CopG family n=1 Tax=Tomitella fengzijianii TaxID=2597660 RepID=A0A516X6N5_9ACTN|nr:YlcI/YnfO family protein [Tomitella fengzijianii]QDQ98729.1 ribbon-helix-helix protein, CopG family [Tomitella fengzijianii]